MLHIMSCPMVLSKFLTNFFVIQIAADQAPFLCLDLSFCYSLLTQGFKVKETSEITLVKRIKFGNEEVEAAWPLGAAINLLS